MTGTEKIAPEFSRPLDLEELPETGGLFELSATPEECAALAKRFDLVSLDRLEAKLTVAWIRVGEAVAVSGRLEAEVVQSCVVTLEPVRNAIEEDLDLIFASDVASADDFDADEVEPLGPEGLDLGELLSEELSLALDPYPRAPDIDPDKINLGPGAELSQEGSKAAENKGRNNPFEVLAGLKPKL